MSKPGAKMSWKLLEYRQLHSPFPYVGLAQTDGGPGGTGHARPRVNRAAAEKGLSSLFSPILRPRRPVR